VNDNVDINAAWEGIRM